MNSIRRRLSRSLLTAMLVLLGGGLAVVYLAAREATIEHFDDALHAKALAISTLTTRTAQGAKLDFSDRFLRGFDDDRARDFFQLWDHTGRVLARSDSLDDDEALPRRMGKPDRPARWNLALPNGRPGRAVGFAFRPRGGGDRNREEGGDRGEVDLVVASDRRELDELLWELLGISASCGALLVVATLWVVPRVLRRGLRPLEELAEQVQGVDAASLATRISSAMMPAELRPVTERLNALLRRLEQSFERERRFSADLAHELRTPLAELRAQAECALKWPESRDAATDRETLAIATHMESIVTHILALARGEQGTVAVKLESLALDAIAAELWRQFAERAAGRGLQVRLGFAPQRVRADAALLRSILANLFDNAVDHAPAGAEIAIGLTASADAVSLRVANPAGDLQPDDMSKLFDRFWRKEAARTAGAHVGLGLSLAHGFAMAMGWTLTAALEQPERLIVFTLRGPRATD